MKKIIAITLVTLTVLFCFAGCKKKADKVSAVVTNGKGNVVAAITNADGNAERDEAGNLYVVVTDANGNVVEKDGEYVTEKVIVDSFVEIGNRYEMPEYSIVIPKKWKNTSGKSHQTLILNEVSNENNKFTIVTGNDENQKSFYEGTIDSLKNQGESKSGEKDLKVLGKDAKLVYACTKVAGDTYYAGFITFNHNNKVVSVFITGTEDMTGKIDEIVSILNTIEFI